MEDSRLNGIECLKLITFVKGRLNFSCKSTTAANVDLTESLLDSWLKNNHITLDKIYYLRSLFAFFTNFSFQIYFSTAENRHKIENKLLWQLAKIRLEWISQSNGSIGSPLGFVIDRLNTSASFYRIAPCLRCVRWAKVEILVEKSCAHLQSLARSRHFGVPLCGTPISKTARK